MLYLRDVEQAHGLPSGQRQASGSGAQGVEYRDVLYQRYALRVELDGRVGHQTSDERRRDMRRDNAGLLAGEVTLRYGWVQVRHHACAVAAEVSELLVMRGWSGVPRTCRAESCAVELTRAAAG